MGQRRHGPDPLDTLGDEDVSQKLGWEILQRFRALWQVDGYRYRFELKIMPRREKSEYAQGLMVGETNERGVAIRFDLFLEERGNSDNSEDLPGAQRTRRFLLQSGLNAYAMAQPSEGEKPPEVMDAEELFQPLAGSDFTVFDLLAPFIYWQRFVYEGRTTERSRPVQVFSMYPPDDDKGVSNYISKARLFIDHEFNGLVKTELYGPDGELAKTLSLLDFRKVDGHWIFGSMEARDERTRDKTRFRVTDAAVGLDLPDSLFSAQSLMSDLSGQRIYPENTAFIEKIEAE